MSDATSADLIAAARMQVHMRMPYLSTTLFSLRPHEAVGLGTMAVDAGWRLYYDPLAVAKWHQEEVAGKVAHVGGQGKPHDGVAGVIFHELGHVMRQHSTRLQDKDPACANVAMDREINDDVRDAGWVLPGTPLMPKDIGMDDGLTAEEYYLEPITQQFMVVVSIPGSGGKCGGCAGNPTDWEKQNTSAEGSGLGHPGSLAPPPGDHQAPGGLPEPVDAVSQEVALRQTALAIQSHVKNHGKGSVPAGMQAWAQSKLRPPKVDWRKRLAALTRQSLAAVAGACDYTWKKPGRRSLYSAGRTGWPIAPSLHQPTPRVGIVLDTSGSMSSQTADGRTCEDDALSEVAGIARAAGAEVWAVACDAQAYDVVRVASERDLKKLNKGGGGTDMAPGFDAVMKKHPDLVVIVTDGYVSDDWPSQEACRGVRVLAVLVGGCAKPPAYIPYLEATP